MRLLDLFSGIGGFSLAFERAGFETVAFSEIEPFPCKVLRHHWPEVPNPGSVMDIDGAEVRERFGHIDVVTFGSPCQDWSVAGKRLGLEGQRSSLFHEAIRIIRGVRPTFAVFENVPGLFSAAEGWDFAAVLDEMAESGALDIAWSVLDAQWFGVPQRRRRIFLIADFRGERAGEILFESESVSGNPTPGGKAGERIADSLTVGANQYSGFPREPVEQKVAGTLGGGSGARGWAPDTDRMTFVPEVAPESRSNFYSDHDGDENRLIPEVAGGQATRYGKGVNTTADDGAVIPTGFYANAGYKEDPVSGASAPLKGGKENAGQAAVAFDTTQITHPENRCNPQPGDPSHPLAAGAHPPTIAFALRGREDGAEVEVSGDATSSIRGADGGSSRDYVAQPMSVREDQRTGSIYEMPYFSALNQTGGKPGQGYAAIREPGMAVRRLTPGECEKLQGFPPGWTNIPGASDAARYRAVGNAIAVPVACWIAERLFKAAIKKDAA